MFTGVVFPKILFISHKNFHINQYQRSLFLYNPLYIHIWYTFTYTCTKEGLRRNHNEVILSVFVIKLCVGRTKPPIPACRVYTHVLLLYQQHPRCFSICACQCNISKINFTVFILRSNSNSVHLVCVSWSVLEEKSVPLPEVKHCQILQTKFFASGFGSLNLWSLNLFTYSILTGCAAWGDPGEGGVGGVWRWVVVWLEWLSLAVLNA